ncbi:MAG TPA: hypothetical protein VKL40_10360 [Candidatus Angelobacter sp.]|nr:hypothetical protein [Candidatus Angelobacter sp.]
MKLTSPNFVTPAGHQPLDEYTDAPVWLQRTFVGTYVLFCMVLGLWLVVLPWTNNWFPAGFVSRWPALQEVLRSGFVRGAVSGLGLVDIWCGVLEVIHYHDRPPGNPGTNLAQGGGGTASPPDGNSHDGQH